MNITKLGTEKVRWKFLPYFYTDPNSEEIDNDLAELYNRAEFFRQDYCGKVASDIGGAMTHYERIDRLMSKLVYGFILFEALDPSDPTMCARKAHVEDFIRAVESEFLSFFELEVAALESDVLETACSDALVLHYRPWIESVRRLKPHLLSEETEAVLARMENLQAKRWAEFFTKLDSKLRYTVDGQALRYDAASHILRTSKDPLKRAKTLEAINTGLKEFAEYSAQTLNTVIYEGHVVDSIRHYKHPMQSSNLDASLSDEVVECHIHAMLAKAAPLTRDYYRLKAQLHGVKKLTWADKSAPLPFASTTKIPWTEALAIVTNAYEDLSPTLGALIRTMIENEWIDAHPTSKKVSGAFNASVVLPDGTPVAYTLLNYQGSLRDVLELAHELGHGAHQLIAGGVQGNLMRYPAPPYCETASIFGEMLTFELLKKRLLAGDDPKAYLALLMQKLDDTINTTVRQIGFLLFERQLHGLDEKRMLRMPYKEHSAEEICRIWKGVWKRLLGNSLWQRDTEYLWASIPHFHEPFYVGAYSIGEMVVHSLLAARESHGSAFAGKYLDVLRAGSTKSLPELLKPFGFDPQTQVYWEHCIDVSIGAMLRETKRIARDLNLAK